MGKSYIILFIYFLIDNLALLGQDQWKIKEYYLLDSLNIDEYSVSDKKLLDSTLNVYHLAKHDTDKLVVLEALVAGMFHDDWLKYNEEARTLANLILENTDSEQVKKKCKEVIAGSIFNLGYWNEINGHHQNSIECLQEAQGYYWKLKDTLSIITCYDNIAFRHKDLGNYKQAFKNLKEAFKLAQRINNIEEQIDLLIYLSQFYSNLGNNDAMLKVMFFALRLSEEAKYSWAISTIQNNLGVFYMRQKEYAEAIKYFEESIISSEGKNSAQKMARIYNNMGVIYSNLKKPNESLEKHFAALELRISINSRKEQAESYQNIGSLYYSMNQLDSAIYYYEKGLALSKEVNDNNYQVSTLNNLAVIYNELGKQKKALEFSMRANAFAQKSNNVHYIMNTYETLANTHKLLNNFKQSDFYFREFIAIRDSIINESDKIKVREMEFQYLAKKKEGEIALLNEQNKVQELEISKKNRLIWGLIGAVLLIIVIIVLFIIIQKTKASKKEADFARKQSELKQQALRAQMNPHFLFNSLNSIQRIYVEGNMMLANDYMADFSTLLRSILNNSDKEKISLKEDLQMLELYLTMEKIRTDGQITHEIKIDSKIDQMNTYIAPMLIQPFVENSIWHGILPSKRNGEIKINIKKHNDQLLECVVEDNGIGIFKSRENKKENHISKGISLTKERLGGLGEIFEEELLSEGSRVTIKIPIL